MPCRAAVYLTDRIGRIVFMNRAAEHQACAGDALRVENDRLSPIDRAAHATMENALTRPSSTRLRSGRGVSVALPGATTAGLVATVLPLTRGERCNVCGAFAAMRRSSCEPHCRPRHSQARPSPGSTG